MLGSRGLGIELKSASSNACDVLPSSLFSHFSLDLLLFVLLANKRDFKCTRPPRNKARLRSHVRRVSNLYHHLYSETMSRFPFSTMDMMSTMPTGR